MSRTRDVDVVIAGAGPAGAVAAFVLATAGRRVLLVDPRLAEAGVSSGAEPGADADTTRRRAVFGESLPGAARRLLRDLGLLARVERGPHAPSAGHASAWGSSRLETRDAFLDPDGAGWCLDRAVFDRDLRRAALDTGATGRAAHVRSVDGPAVSASSEPAVRGWRVTLGDGTGVTARRLVDATGRHATLARALGVRRRRDDGLVALYAWAAASTDDHDLRTLVEATAEGWWYTARLPTGARVAGLHVDADEARSILHSPRGAAAAWREHLERTHHVHAATHGARFDAPRAREACGARLETFGGDGWLAVGDAALSFDPLASQGIFHALYTGARAGEVVAASLDRPAEADVLRRHYAARLESVRSAYLAHHRAYYRAEGRWPDRPFWRPRRR